MKNLKLLPLLGIVVCALLSFTNFDQDNVVKDGTYNAQFHSGSRISMSNFDRYSIDVTVKIENGVIENITPTRDNININESTKKLLSLPMNLDSKGDAFVEATGYSQNVYNKKDNGSFSISKLKITKKELNK